MLELEVHYSDDSDVDITGPWEILLCHVHIDQNLIAFELDGIIEDPGIWYTLFGVQFDCTRISRGGTYLQHIFTLIDENETRFNLDDLIEEQVLGVTYFELNVAAHVDLPNIPILLLE